MISSIITLLLIVPLCVEGGKVLILPGEYSHWHNMRMIVEELAERNHSVTVLVNSASPSVKSFQDDRVNFQVFQVPLEKHEVNAMWNEFIDIRLFGQCNIYNTSSRSSGSCYLLRKPFFSLENLKPFT